MSFLEAKTLVKRYNRRGESFFAVDGVDFVVESGEFVCITGHSGSGKSTLLNMLTGLLKPDDGEIVLDGKVLTKLSDNELAKLRRSAIGYIPQGNTLLYNLSVIENIALPADLSNEKASLQRAKGILERIGMSHLENESPHNLSGGESRRATIARGLIAGSKIIVADEPTGDIDPENADGIWRLFEEINRDGITVIIVTHDRQIPKCADKHFVMRKGKLRKAEV
jgi:putative ABC transport system ATP-binding protein